MNTSAKGIQSIPFLHGGGEMGKLIRSKDWSLTPVGDPETWPQSLRITLGILLSSKFPMFLWWGKELICFYNDAYRPSLGKDGKHPNILGQPAEQAWYEIWHIIKPLIDQVVSGGEATWSEDQLVPIYRNGHIEDVYWTFSYSPVNDEHGNVAGVLVICTETTEKVITLNKLEESNDQLHFAIEATELGTWDYNPASDKFSANDRLKEWFGMSSKEEIELPHAIDVIAENDKQKVTEAIQRALTFSSGGRYDIIYTIVHPITKKETIVHAKGRAWFNDEKVAYRFNGTLEDVTEQITAQKKIEENEERLNVIIEASELGTWELNLKTDEMSYSARYLEIFGYKNNINIDHLRFIDHIHPDDSKLREEAFEKSLKTGTLNYEVRLIWNDKSIHWVEAKGKVFYDEERKPVKIIGTIRDTTDKKNQQQVLMESEQKFRLLADSMPQHIWTSDSEGNLNYYNQSVFNFTGLTPQQINKDGWLQIIHPDDMEENINQWMQSVKTGEPFLFEHRFRRHDGEYRWQLSRAIPQLDNTGRIQMWVGTSTDIHDIKQNEQLKDDFIKMASHELKTPVTTIKGYIQLLMNIYKDDTDAKLSSSLSTINKHVSKLTRLITDLLDVTKIETGSLHLAKENFSINTLIKEIIEDIQTTTTTHTIIFNADTETIVCADKDRIAQVLINLLVNAIKYSPDKNKVIITTKLLANELLISFQDFGIGIDAADHENIFKRFYRVQGKFEKTFPGFGIGLFIVKEIIANHQGRIWVESEKNKGAIFSFCLPLLNENQVCR